MHDTNRVCNLCGKKLDFWDLQEDYSIHKFVGYGSKYDEDEVDLNICCDCFDEIIDSCIVSPVVSQKECGG